MRTDPRSAHRAAALALPLAMALTAAAQDAPAAAPGNAPLFPVDHGLLYAMVGIAVVQVIFIVSLSGILRTLGGPGAWARRFKGNGGRAALLVPLVLFASGAQAQAYVGEGGTIPDNRLFWVLLAVNVLLFALLLGQLSILRGLTRSITGTEAEAAGQAAGPSWLDRIMARVTRQVSMEKEADIMLDHNYDGIRELDNVLPPWWLWLFYGTVIWGAVYLVNMHVSKVWPDQRTEYSSEMSEAKARIDAYMATLSNTVDENTVKVNTDPALLAQGASLFKQNCVACHGPDAAGSETSVGPNLTDAYWIHGGGVKNVFHTISFGVPEKGMISWKTQLKPAEVAALTNYVLSLKGTGPATQKAPQGDLWVEPAATDSTAAPVDTTAVPADTLRVAQR